MKQISFETVSRYDRHLLPATAMLPFAKGEMKGEDVSCNVLRDDRNSFPFQPVVTSTWDDGSVRCLALRMLADFEADRPKTFTFAPAIDSRKEKGVPTVQFIANEDRSAVLRNSFMEVKLGRPGSALIEKVSSRGTALATTDGPMISNGMESFAASTGDSGWELAESGDIYVCASTRGRHHAENGKTWFDFIFSVGLWAGSGNIEIEYRIINTEKAKCAVKELVLNNEQAGLKYDDEYPRELLASLRFSVIPEKDEETVKKLFTSSFNFHSVETGKDGSISALANADTIIDTANEMFPEVMFSTFGCSWKAKGMYIGTETYQAYQNFPKSLHVEKDRIDIGLFPEECEPIEFPQGVQKTHKFFIYVMDGSATDHDIVDNLLTLEMPPVGHALPSEFIASGCYGKEVSLEIDHPTERFLYRFVDSRAKGLGFFNFGDCPEWEYSKQGRSKGKDVWINNEYDMVHDFMVMYVRSGDRRYFDYLQAAVRHWMDVDFCHYSERRYHEGLLYTHSINHVSGQMVPSHQWVQGFLDYWHLTGSREAYDTAMTIGEKLEELVRLPMYSQPGMVEPREIGWALRNFLDLYTETHDERWKDDCQPIVDTYIRWTDLLGSWTSPYPDNYMDRVPFMMQVGIGGLYGYYRLDPRPEIKDTLLKVIDDIAANCYNERLDMFLGKMHPAIRFQNLNGMVLETMEIGYELTGDISYLRKGLGMFSWITRENNPPIYDFSKVKRDEYTVIYNCPVGPKRFAQTLIPLLRYYTAAMENGLIQSAI